MRTSIPLDAEQHSPGCPYNNTDQGLGKANRVDTPTLGGRAGYIRRDERAGGVLWRRGAPPQPRVGSRCTGWGWGCGCGRDAPLQSAAVREEGSQEAKAPCSEREPTEGTPRALPDTTTGTVRQGDDSPASSVLGCQTANGK